MAIVTLRSLKCVKTTDDNGKTDEIYLRIFTDGLEGKLPEGGHWDMDPGETQTIDRAYSFLKHLRVVEMEKDTAKDDVVGEFTFDSQIQPPGSPLEFTGHRSLYELSFTFTA